MKKKVPAKIRVNKQTTANFIVSYFTTKRHTTGVILFAFFLGIILGAGSMYVGKTESKVLSAQREETIYWLLLHRKSNLEFLYKGVPNKKEKSTLVKTFQVKTGVPGEKPTPLPKLLGRDYWLLIKKEESQDNPETAPYFLTLDVPVSDEEPYGPVPYKECTDQFTNEPVQCNWEISGYFGLHGVGGDNSKLSSQDSGSSGCIRHSDSDITFLYNLLDPTTEEIRYYIEDV